MSNIKKKLSDAIPQQTSGPVGESRHGKPVPDHATATEQARVSQESKEATEGRASIRDRMVAIGRGNQQSGRQGE